MQMERLEKLKTRIKEISCNELRRIYPFQLQEWVGVEERELGTFIDELLKANLMEDMDAESFWGMKHAMEKDEEEERRNH